MAELLGRNDDIELFLAPQGEQSGVLSFRVRGTDCERIAAELSKEDTQDSGTVRLSFSPFNTHGEIERAAAKLKKII